MNRECRVGRHARGWRVVSVVCWLVGSVVCVGTGCRRIARSPEQAFARFQNAVAARDPAALFEALDQRSRWAWMTIQKSHREAYDIILSNYPEGPERERELRRFQKGAILGSGRELFAAEMGARALAGFANPVPAAARFEPDAATAVPEPATPTGTATGTATSGGGAEGQGAVPPESAQPQVSAVLPDGTRLPFRRGLDGGWGLASFARESAERQNRALHDVDLVRASAADYERAATRANAASPP